MRFFVKPLVFASVICLMGCSAPNQPWAVWQRISAKTQAMVHPEAHHVTQKQEA